MTIRGRIMFACVVMSLVTAGLGTYATLGIRDTGVLVNKTYDESLMSINYARAAATDFASMQVLFGRRWIAVDPVIREKISNEIEARAKSLAENLHIALKRSQSDRSKRAAGSVQRAADAWREMSERLLDSTRTDASWEQLDYYAEKVEEQIDLLVNHTAGDGFLYRQSAQAAVRRDIWFNIAGTALAIALLALIALALAHRIIRPVAMASNIAEQIASGQLDVVVPKGSADELGNLLESMALMRDNIKTAMEREVAQRRSAQARLADALESSQEGIVVVDAERRIALANAQAANFFAESSHLLKVGTPLPYLWPAMEADSSSVLAWRKVEAPTTSEIELPDLRWLRVSHSATREGGFIVVCSDITESKMQKARLSEINLRMDAALDNMSQGLCMFDQQSQLQVVNRRFFEIFEIADDKIRIGQSYREVLELTYACGNRDGRTLSDLITEQANLLRRDGRGTHYYQIRSGRVVASVYRATADGGWVATYEDVTERRQAEAQIMHMARHDALTDLPNRVQFREKVEQALARGEKISVLYIDLDRFKGVNDTLGHPVGDALLCRVTERLRELACNADTVARLGGDEFAVVQKGLGPTGASELATKIISSLSEPFDLPGHQVVIGASIGIASAPRDGSEPDQLLRNADMALYRAKSDGRGTHHFFEPDMDAKMQARHTLELDLRRALAANEFELYYQPIIDLASGNVAGFEALVRWNHPERGLVSPFNFISVMEDIGLIVPLGEWVLKQACREATTWPGKLSVAINLSPVQFRNQTLALSVVNALGSSGLDSRRLELELTESIMLQDDRSVKNTLHKIRGLGVKIAMDDFGTGFSSLSYLRSFPFDKIKIDQSFIQELSKKEDCVAIVRAVTRLGSNLGMVTTAEGVETRQQLEILRAEGCTQVQGYLFSPPVTAKEVPHLLKRFAESFKPLKRRSVPKAASMMQRDG
jgi:diguanylate cyclase (GGDEF)-like protein